MRILMVLDREVNQPEVLLSFIESSALVLGLKYCQDGGEPILERMAVNHDRAAGPDPGPDGPPCLRLCPAHPGNPRSNIEGESPLAGIPRAMLLTKDNFLTAAAAVRPWLVDTI